MPVVIPEGIERTPEQERDFQQAAADLPSAWVVSVSMHPGLNLFDVRVDRGPDGTFLKGFAPDGFAEAIRWLRGLKAIA